MATVTQLSEYHGVISLYLNGSFALKIRRKHFELCPLQAGDEVDPEEYTARISAIQMGDAYEAALTSLDQNAKTSAQIVRFLIQRGYVPPCAEAVAARLAENGLVNDRSYARRVVEISASGAVGVYAVKRKLRAKGVSEEDAEEAVGVLDDRQQREAARLAAESLSRKYRKLPNREARTKLSQALARRGFSWDIIPETVEAALDGDAFDDDQGS